MFDSTNYNSVVLLMLLLLLLLLGMNVTSSSHSHRGRRMMMAITAAVRGRALARITAAADAAVVAVAVTVDARTLVERVQMLRRGRPGRGRYPLLLLLLHLPDKVRVVAVVAQVDLVGVVVEETLLLLLSAVL